MKSIVLYYTRTGNTKTVAEMLAKEAKADIEEIIDTKDRSGAIGWIAAGRDATLKKVTKIKPLKTDLSKYKTIFIGQPIWASAVVPAIRTLIKDYDLSNKNIVLFSTMGGNGDKKSYEMTNELISFSKLIASITILEKDLKKDPKSVTDKIKNLVKNLKL